MRSIKNVIRRSFIYKKLEFGKALSDAKRWTPQDQRMMEFYSEFLPSDSLCFDVGSNMGNRVKIFLKLKARVIAIEPQEICNSVVRAAFGKDPRLTVLQKALGEKPGEGELMITDTTTLSTLSNEWVNAVKQSGRFAEFLWTQKQVVPMTTLDALIDEYGLPTFIKIDVEGYEFEVIKGLSRPVHTISLEFTPEYIDGTLSCINRLEELGDIRLNYSCGENMRVVLDNWVTSTEMKAILAELRNDTHLFGDVYVRFPKVA
jgi:FkbM family methyltransferase